MNGSSHSKNATTANDDESDEPPVRVSSEDLEWIIVPSRETELLRTVF